MNDKKIKSAQKTIRISVILRLLFTAVLMLLLANEYSYEHENVLRLYHGYIYRLIIIIFGFFFDTLLTILWLYRPKLHTLHLVLYVVFGGILYIVYVVDLFNTGGMGYMLAIFLAPFIWLIGLVPFIVCWVGRRNLTIAQDYTRAAEWYKY